MNFPPYTYNGNTVEGYGRLFYIVSSNSRKGLIHFVDLEGGTYWHEISEGKFEERKWKHCCTCESWKYGIRPCRHISACFHAIAHWAGVKEAIREEWADRLMFLLNMGHSFRQALESPSLQALKQSQPAPAEKPTPQRTVRKYVLPPRSTVDKPKRFDKKKGCHAPS